VTWIGILGLIAGLVLVRGVTSAARRKRPSIHAMLDDSRRCAVRARH
jgi:hypothetical protein